MVFFGKVPTVTLGLAPLTPEVKLHVVGGTDLSLNGGGTIVMGLLTGNNLALDNTKYRPGIMELQIHCR
jgi:hypothetical protein